MSHLGIPDIVTQDLGPEDILVVDDNPANLKLLADILTQAGYAVRPACDGELALRSVLSGVPALILLDHRMPGMSGLEVCRRLKADPRTRAVPVLFLSAVEETSLKVQAFEAGAVDYVTKPFEPAEVLARIHTHLRMDRLQRQLKARTAMLSAQMEERRRLEQEVIQLEGMRVSEELAAGVSHNLNNILTAVLGPAHVLLRHSQDPVVRRHLETILTAGNRARDLVSRLGQAVRYARATNLGPVSLNAQVQAAVHQSRARWKDTPESPHGHVEVVARLGEIPDIQGNPSEFADAILALILNAVEAMPEGGVVTIATQAVGIGVQLAVSDTGTGMDEETCRRIFEPFFTTKGTVGSGLGLSLVRATVTRSGGTIQVDSTPGSGTTVTLSLPSWTETASQSCRQ